MAKHDQGLNPRKAKFARLIARGGLSQKACALKAGYKKSDCESKSSKLMKCPFVQDEVIKLQAQYSEASTTDATWIRDQLKMVIAKSGQGEEIMVKGSDGELIGTGEFKYDAPGVNKALDTLNRMNGGYEKDNTQKSGNVKVHMKF